MTEFNSNRLPVNASSDEVYNFLSDFTNFSHLMPPQVKNWRADTDSCSFTVEGLADLNMRMASRNPGSNINIVADGKNPVDYTLDVFMFPKGEANSEVEIVFNAKLNAFMKMMASRPLKNFVDMLGQKIQEHFA